MKFLLTLIFLAAIGFAVYKAIQASKEDADFKQVKKLPPTVQNVVVQMDAASQAAFFNEMDKKRKKISVSYILWIVLGLHYLYNRKVGLQVFYWLTAGGFGLWALADLFRMPSIVRGANEIAAREALQTLSLGSAFDRNRSVFQQGPSNIDPALPST